jgi:hypothetical protein
MKIKMKGDMENSIKISDAQSEKLTNDLGFLLFCFWWDVMVATCREWFLYK